jgi:outer membrane protein OmpA-like peptidoglycan-associated protein
VAAILAYLYRQRVEAELRERRARVAAILSGTAGNVYAADQPAAAAGTTAASGESLQEVVVTATATGVKKLDASYNIVSVSANDIAMTNPAAASDIYKLSPGVWPENSGGQTGVNIDVAGHTDTKEADNLSLSALRANAVRDYLVGGGVVPSRVTTRAEGEFNQQVLTVEGVRLRDNRVVVVTIH